MIVRPGLVLEGYEFMEPIGEGGFSSVYKVRSQKYDQIFVAKVARIKDENIERAWEAFDCEFQALLRLDHPNIIQLYARYRYGNNFILILEYCPNGSLADFIRKKGALDGNFLAQTIREICLGLQYAWAQGVQHRDIKPANIMFSATGRIKLVDFGISIISRQESSGLVQDFKCSRICAAPEILRRIPYDPVKSDIWAVGVTILWMMKGSSPWQAANKDEMKKMINRAQYTMPDEASPAVANLVRKMLSVIPEERVFPTEEELNNLGPSVTIRRTEAHGEIASHKSVRTLSVAGRAAVSNGAQSLEPSKRNRARPLTVGLALSMRKLPKSTFLSDGGATFYEGAPVEPNYRDSVAGSASMVGGGLQRSQTDGEPFDHDVVGDEPRLGLAELMRAPQRRPGSRPPTAGVKKGGLGVADLLRGLQ